MVRYCSFIAILALGAGLPLNARDKELTSQSKVKITASASKIEKIGEQTLTVTVTIDKGWHIYANPVNSELVKDAATVVKVGAKSPVSDVKVAYPPGKRSGDIEKFDAYEGTAAERALRAARSACEISSHSCSSSRPSPRKWRSRLMSRGSAGSITRQ